MLPVREVDLPEPDDGFLFVSGRLSLDLVATIGQRGGMRFERLRTHDDLGRWLAEAGLRPVAPAEPRDLAGARELRGGLELVSIAYVQRRGLPRQAVAVVNSYAAVPDPAPRLVGGTLRVSPQSAAVALSAVARDAISLFGSPLAGRVRECAAPQCALVYVDLSRTSNRRWCSMKTCGNRSKVARHRQRRSD